MTEFTAKNPFSFDTVTVLLTLVNLFVHRRPVFSRRRRTYRLVVLGDQAAKDKAVKDKAARETVMQDQGEEVAEAEAKNPENNQDENSERIFAEDAEPEDLEADTPDGEL